VLGLSLEPSLSSFALRSPLTNSLFRTRGIATGRFVSIQGKADNSASDQWCKGHRGAGPLRTPQRS